MSTPAEESTPARVAAVSIKLPPFWPKQAGMWFRTIESQFNLRGITDDQTKFDYTLTTLDADTQERVADFFDELPAKGLRYDAFKRRVLESFRLDVNQRMASLVNLSIGDDTPSRLLDRMLALYRPDTKASTNPLFRYHFLQKLPLHIRDQLAPNDHYELRELAKCADKVMGHGPTSGSDSDSIDLTLSKYLSLLRASLASKDDHPSSPSTNSFDTLDPGIPTAHFPAFRWALSRASLKLALLTKTELA
ncbi:uncharacterized protein LOC108865287 [Galendromus occidentalis]|uniref:Uncharacterized protein LOC108865287 n=1 Tax=Galendromus occidentalis TaxID=34638 RepID=A0AAJ7L924_9ACAR|nr:uncharacterized protein LOC108865287 [Galendromus occidentalis]